MELWRGRWWLPNRIKTAQSKLTKFYFLVLYLVNFRYPVVEQHHFFIISVLFIYFLCLLKKKMKKSFSLELFVIFQITILLLQSFFYIIYFKLKQNYSLYYLLIFYFKINRLCWILIDFSNFVLLIYWFIDLQSIYSLKFSMQHEILWILLV